MTLEQYLVKRLTTLEAENETLTSDNNWRKQKVESLLRINDTLHKDLEFLASLIILRDGVDETKYYQTEMIFEKYEPETFKRIANIKESLENELPF